MQFIFVIQHVMYTAKEKDVLTARMDDNVSAESNLILSHWEKNAFLLLVS